jgi:hypothetical protein
MNYIHSKSQNTLSLKAVDKLLFVYINTRTLRNLNNYELSDSKLLAIEDKLMG